jgi:hypothetical protein
VITDPHRWNVGAARLKGFVINLPQWPHEKHVDEYHSILADFSESCDRDFSSFKIPDSALSHSQHKPTHSFFEPAIQDHEYCDSIMFRTKVFGLAQYAAMLVKDTTPQVPRAQKEPETLKEMAAQIYIGEMHGSQFVHSSSGTSIQNTYNPKSDEFKELVKKIKDAIPKLGLEKDQATQLYVDIGTVEVQISAPTPKHSIIAESMHSIRNIFEGAIGSAIASGLLPAIIQYFPK